MFGAIASKIFGTKNKRELKRLGPLVEVVSGLEPEMKTRSDQELRQLTGVFKERLSRGASLEEIMPEAFAAVREASVRALGLRPFDVQILGAIALHEGKIAEMKTGEGKTLVATMPVYLNALTGKGVHIVTVNDYLAKRDSEWMGAIYKFMGLGVGAIVHELDDDQRREAYGCDVIYGTNNEFGFDYLRDNMKYDLSDYVQRDLYYAIVDEVDSILIDEARTPLIISGPTDESTDKYYKINRVIPGLKRDHHYSIDEKSRTVVLTEEGLAKVEERLGVENLYDHANMETLHHVNQALKAHTLFKRDVDYVVKEGKVTIVDEFTGRLMPGRRYSDGLHQALEAKENVRIENENQTLASITFQNYFRMYEKLAGMTGTADTEAEEFAKIYKLDVLVVPTNLPMIRDDNADVIYKTEKEKFRAAVDEIKELHQAGQPVLVGTVSIEKSEMLSNRLSKLGIKHNVLNAKHHEREAEIIAQAGRKGAVTISTNMAGRGTDIMLGGNPEFMAKAKHTEQMTEPQYQEILNGAKIQCEAEKKEVLGAGGLHVLGTERHESRRIDNQLRGRSGRQGDPGSSRFYLSLEDDLLRIFGSERISSLMDRLGIEEGQVIEHPWITRAIANAQKKVESHNFDIRKNLLEFDDVMNQQRKAIYTWRRDVLKGDRLKEMTTKTLTELAESMALSFASERGRSEDWDWAGIEESMLYLFNIEYNPSDSEKSDISGKGLQEKIVDMVLNRYREREEEFGKDGMRHVEKMITLQTIDKLWKDHLLAMDHLREGIGLRGYGQKDPVLEYKKEGFEMFINMEEQVHEDVVQRLFRVQLATPEQMERLREAQRRQRMILGGPGDGTQKREPIKKGVKVGRNEPCPCGSGKKYKKCCGA